VAGNAYLSGNNTRIARPEIGFLGNTRTTSRPPAFRVALCYGALPRNWTGHGMAASNEQPARLCGVWLC